MYMALSHIAHGQSNRLILKQMLLRMLRLKRKISVNDDLLEAECNQNFHNRRMFQVKYSIISQFETDPGPKKSL